MAQQQMPKFLEDYVKVDDLIKEMNKQYPEGRLVTEIVEKTSEMVVFKTSFYEDGSDVPKCTGHGSKQSNERDWLEKAEQKSRGRCLRVLLGSEPTSEEMEGIAPSKNEKKPIQKQKVTYKYENEDTPKTNFKVNKVMSLDEKVKDLEDEGLVEDVSQKKQALMDNIKDFTLSLTGNDLDKAKLIAAQALGELHINKNDVNINNLQTIKNTIQDIVTFKKSEQV
mgnify:CR=1 FL=1|tara:strand:- start:18716 stop:19387 length:672 start_codon:yes stop_codon:yes gene_type:complete